MRGQIAFLGSQSTAIEPILMPSWECPLADVTG